MDNLDKLKSIFDENKLGCRIEERASYDGETTIKYLLFDFPVAREFEEIRITDYGSNIDSIINSDFIKYRGISDYEGIWSNELGCIECEINATNLVLPQRYILRKLSRYLGLDEDESTYDVNEREEPTNIVLYSSDEMKVSIGYASKEFFILSINKDGRRYDFDKDMSRIGKVTIKIEDVAVKTQDEAKKILEKISNTLFFQVDVLFDFPITLSPRRESRYVRIKKGKKAVSRDKFEKRDIDLKYEYDEIPMALYWLAQSSSYSPIFRYFALYQVIEYYYPIYATINTKTKIQNLIKDPKFNINNDSDILRLLAIIETNSAGNVGDERGQLNNTLINITNGDDIIAFIAERQELNDYYTGKNAKKLSDKKLRLNDHIGIMDDVGARIYDIRCKIVHNKASETDNKILPMTKDIEYLVNEVELLEFIARKAIIANSKQVSFN